MEQAVYKAEEKVKIVFLGNPGVGKTSILNCWICGAYNDKVSPTIAAANVQKEVMYGGKPVKAVICDTAGEERYQSLCGNFIHGADCAIIVCSYDIEASEKAIDTWIDLVYEKCPVTTNVIIAKNKKDLQNEYDDTSIYNGYSVYHVSAKTGEGIDVLLTAAVQQACISHSAVENENKIRITYTPNTQPDSKCC
jgi:small GTP-binding protein